jgi:hypothetical protein
VNTAHYLASTDPQQLRRAHLHTQQLVIFAQFTKSLKAGPRLAAF